MSISPEVLAFSRSQVAATFTDSCIISRRYTPTPSGPSPTPGASDGRGGSSGGSGQPGVVKGYKDDATPTACRLEYLVPRKGSGEEMSPDAIEAKTSANLALPYNTVIRDEDRVKVTEAATGRTRTWEVLTQSPHSEQFSLQVSIELIGDG